MSRLSNGQPFPDLQLQRVGGGTLSLPGDLAGSFGVVLFYRGDWCPFCNAQLAAFARSAENFAEIGIKVAALSVDSEEAAAKTVERNRIGFPVGHSADVDAVSAATGAYVSGEGDERYLESTGFLLDPDGAVLTAVYSSSAIGRLVASDVAGFVRYVKSHA